MCFSIRHGSCYDDIYISAGLRTSVDNRYGAMQVDKVSGQEDGWYDERNPKLP